MASSTRRPRTNIGITNLSTRRSRSTPRARPATADPMELRMRETTTWKKTPVPSPTEWVSISKKPLWESQTLEFESMQQARADRLQKFVEQEQQMQLRKVKRRLTEAATKKFGSVAAMFGAFGLAEDDTVGLDQLTALLTKHDLHEQVPRSDQRLLFAFANNHHEHANVRQLLECLPSSEPAVPELEPTVELIRADVADRFVQSRRSQKLPTDNLYLKRALMDEFRLLGQDQAGTVTVEQVQRAFGPKRLNLGIPDDQLQKLLQAVPAADDGKVKYNELVKLLSMEDKTALYSPYFDLRTKVHTMHKVNVQTPWPFMKETEELLQLGLEREQDAFIKQLNPSDELARTRVIPFEQGVPLHLRPHTVHSHMPVRGNQQEQEQSLRRVVSSHELSQEIDRAQTSHQRTRSIVRSPQLSLWDDDSSVDAADHYRTMTDEYFGPLDYSPITTFTRKTVSDAERGAIKRERRRRARYRRVEEYYKAAKERQKMDDLAARMNDHQRVMNLAEHMLRNAEIVSAADELRAKRQPYGYPTRRFMPEQHATTVLGSRDGHARYIREMKEDRDFCTVYSKDFCKSALVHS